MYVYIPRLILSRTSQACSSVTYMYVCIFMFMCVCVCIYIYIYIYSEADPRQDISGMDVAKKLVSDLYACICMLECVS